MLVAPFCYEADSSNLNIHAWAFGREGENCTFSSFTPNAVQTAKLFLQGESHWLQIPCRLPDRGK